MHIDVDPQALIAAGQRTSALGSQLRQLSDALGGALSGGIASGVDPAGMNFGMKYGHQASGFAGAVADAANAFAAVGVCLQATGENYRNADAASTIGGAGAGGSAAAMPPRALPAHVPAGPNGAIVPPPATWHLIQPLLQVIPVVGFLGGTSMTWPSGNSALMGLTAMQWRNLATGFALIEPQMAEIRSAVSAQSIPEGAAIATALDSIGHAITSLAQAASTVAQSVSDFAGHVQETQNAIRRLLDRVSLSGLWDTITGLLTGNGDDILREVTRDVETVLSNFQQQVKGLVGLLDELTRIIGDAATAFQRWIRPILVSRFGDGVGNAVADDLALMTDVQVGALTGLIGTVSGVVAIADPDTWKGMAEMALSVAKDPTTLPGVLENMGKQFVAWDQWSGDHPGRAAGEAAFNIGSLFVPGGALSKTGSVAKGLNLSRRVLEEGRLPRLGEVGGWTRGGTGLPQPSRIPEIGRPGGAAPGRAGGSHTAPAGPRPTTPGAEGGPGSRAPLDVPGRTGDAAAQPDATPRAEPLPGSGAGPDAHHADSIREPTDAQQPDFPTPPEVHHYDSAGRTVRTDDLIHPDAALIDPDRIGDATASPHRIAAALVPGVPSTHPQVQTLVPSTYDPHGGLTAKEWNREFWPSGSVDAQGRPELVWPDPESHPEGFATPESRTPAVLSPGEVFDRFGSAFGRFGSPVGVEFPSRGLPSSHVDAGYHRYEVLRPIPIWQGPAASAMGQTGGGIQYYFSDAIVDLLNAGYLREISA